MATDLIGSGNKFVALVELEKGQKKKIKKVAEEIVMNNKNVKTVLDRSPCTYGKFRLKKQKIILGQKNTEVLHKEYGHFLKLDPRKVYFSPRESTIRRYISKKIKSKEKILLMFAGVGPYAISISKAQPKIKEIVSIEENPHAFRYLKENIRINKVSHLITPVKGDVKNVCKNFVPDFDRIIMPMIKAKDFLELAAKLVKKSGTIDIYMVSKEKELFKDSEKFIAGVFKKIKRQYEIKDMRKISLYAPGKWKVLMEIKLK